MDGAKKKIQRQRTEQADRTHDGPTPVANPNGQPNPGNRPSSTRTTTHRMPQSTYKPKNHKPTTPTPMDHGIRTNPRTGFMGEVYLYQGPDGKQRYHKVRPGCVKATSAHP